MPRLGTPLYQPGTTLRHDATVSTVSTVATSKPYTSAAAYVATLKPNFVRVKNRHASQLLFVEIVKRDGTIVTADTGSWSIEPGEATVFQLPYKLAVADIKVNILGSASGTSYEIIWLP